MGAGLRELGKRLGYAFSLLFTEKELIVFALAQWLVIAGFYLIWVLGVGFMPQEMFEEATKEGTSPGEILFTLWCIFCILAATLPLGILTGCMVAVHVKEKRPPGLSKLTSCSPPCRRSRQSVLCRW